MDAPESGPAKLGPKHLIPPERLARAAGVPRDADLTRARGQGNGLRVHGIYFAVVSTAVLIVFIVAIALASGRM
jgi:hypothetical protein